jgi:hypothetical protein
MGGQMRVWSAALCAVSILVICCGGGGPSLEDYATRGEELTTRVISRIATLDAELQEPTLEGVKDYWDQRVAARVAFLEGIRDLDPPDGLVDLHETALDLFSRLVDAEQALAARVAESGTPTGPSEWWSTPEGQAARAVDQEAIAICHAAQARFDATQERETLEGLPWIPSEMKESVRVAFGCP